MTAATAGSPGPAGIIPTFGFPDRIRKIRRDILNLDQRELAERLGITKAAYAAWESGRNEPRSILTVAKKLELMSGVPAAWVLGVDTPPPGQPLTTERYPTRSARAVTALPQVTRLHPVDQANAAAAVALTAARRHGEIGEAA